MESYLDAVRPARSHRTQRHRRRTEGHPGVGERRAWRGWPGPGSAAFRSQPPCSLVPGPSSCPLMALFLVFGSSCLDPTRFGWFSAATWLEALTFKALDVTCDGAAVLRACSSLVRLCFHLLQAMFQRSYISSETSRAQCC